MTEGQEEIDSEKRARRFFAAVVRLPMEIQMKVSLANEGINEELIGHQLRETAFKELTRNMNQ